MAPHPVVLPPKLPDTPATPRPSAALIVINARNEVLLVQRHPKSRDFGSSTVFPGGNFDPKHDECLEETALRETFEETGLLLVSPMKQSDQLTKLPSRHEQDEARKDIYSHKTTFKQFLSSHGLRPAKEHLLPFSAWVTPPNYPKRFRAQFFVVFLGDVPSTSGFAEGDRQQYLLTPDTSEEISTIRFVHPSTALHEFNVEHKISFPTPQAYNIATLADILTSDCPTSEQQARIRQLSEAVYGKVTLHPLMLVGNGYKGRIVFTYEGDETRGGPVGQVHRSVDWVDDGLQFRSGVLLRNFDIFEMKQEWFEKYSPKL
ncbi:hypothetical protein BXZ70DRAFT_942303 [Cristinia sonorae]|uniref:Nudix hydrolase domain-containing protein n=1 Tax=Cristinia sonorae TaxID=1940300 RepID=A0A8K0XP06_9AGAR|nr:hypothetical protein BXZ70DRAFT_942303 [Cristinia sonorae]